MVKNNEGTCSKPNLLFLVPEAGIEPAWAY
jgi:hypothetical protein